MIFSCESVVNNLKGKKLPVQMNRNRFDLVLTRILTNSNVEYPLRLSGWSYRKSFNFTQNGDIILKSMS